MKTLALLIVPTALFAASCGSTGSTARPTTIAGTEEPTTRHMRESTEAPAAPEQPWEKWNVSAGGLLVAMESDARFGPAGVGVEVNFEDLLGLNSSTSSFRLETAWRFSENRRHRASLSWIDLGRSGETTLENDLTISDGVVIPAGSGIKSGFKLQLIKTEYSYSFFQDERVDLAVGGGFYVAPIDVSLEATGVGSYNDDFSVTAPLPLASLRMDFAITPRWFLRSNLSLFYLKVSEYEGSMSDVSVAAEYLLWKHFAVGLGIDTFGIGVEHNGSTEIPGVNSKGKVDIAYTGAMLYLKGLW